MTTIRTSDGINVLPEDIVYYPKRDIGIMEFIVGEGSAAKLLKKGESELFASYDKCLQMVLDMNESAYFPGQEED